MIISTWWIYKQCAAHNSWKWVKTESGKAKQDALETWAKSMTLAPSTVLPMPGEAQGLSVFLTLGSNTPKGMYRSNSTESCVDWAFAQNIKKKGNTSPYYTCISTAEAVFSFSKERTKGPTFCGHRCHWIPVFQKQRVNESSKLPLQQG